MAGVTGAAGEAAARPVALDGRRGRGSATARPQGRGETHAAGTGPRLEPATPMHAQSMEVGGPGAPTPDAAELVVEAHREDIVLVTILVQQMEVLLVLDALVHIVLKNPQTQEPATQTPAQLMEVGGPGAPTIRAAELVVEAHREDTAIVTGPVQQMEVLIVQDALVELVQEVVLLLPQKQDPVTPTPAPETAAPTPTTGHAAPPPTPVVRGTETVTGTATAAAAWSVAATTARVDLMAWIAARDCPVTGTGIHINATTTTLATEA